MTESRGVRIALRLATVGRARRSSTCPLVILAIYAFNASRIQAWPPTGFTLHWFGEALDNPAIRAAFVNSLIVATIATGDRARPRARWPRWPSSAIASSAARRSRSCWSCRSRCPASSPASRCARRFMTFGIDFGLLTIIVGHATFCVVIAYNNVVARLRRLPRSPEEASADLGADTFTTFRRITLPGMGTALLSGALLAFALSFDEIIVTNFTAGAGDTDDPALDLHRDPAPDRAAGRQRRRARS